jgi:hypothetical protein
VKAEEPPPKNELGLLLVISSVIADSMCELPPSPCNLRSAIEALPLLELVAEDTKSLALDECGVARWAEGVFRIADFAGSIA